MALGCGHSGEGEPKAGEPESGAGGSAYGGLSDYEAPLYMPPPLPVLKRGLGRQAIIRQKCLTLMAPLPQQYRTNHLSIDLAEEALVGQRCSVPLGPPSSAHPPSSPASPGNCSIQRAPPPASASTSTSTCPSSSINATASSCANRCPGGTGRASIHDCTKN